ncbi:MAG: prenyltransferase/squalene oxidase repeat-containing protein, partial [Chitinophagaceae bacterium]
MRKKTGLMVCLLLFAHLLWLPAATAQQWKKNLLTYINSLEKPSGGWGWEDQPDAHITPTFAVVGILYHIGALPRNRSQKIAFIRAHHPQRGGSKETGPSGSQLRNLTYQQIQAILWLGGDASFFKDEVEGWDSQAGNISNYETHGYPALTQEVMSPVCRSLLKLSFDGFAKTFLPYLMANKRSNGSFNNAPAGSGGDGNILNTWWSIAALQALREEHKPAPKTISWINSCQRSNGGFTHQPTPVIGTNDDVAYTWAAVKTLTALGAVPVRKQDC